MVFQSWEVILEQQLELTHHHYVFWGMYTKYCH